MRISPISAYNYNIAFAKKGKKDKAEKEDRSYPGGMTEKQFKKFQLAKGATEQLVSLFRDPEFEARYQDLPEGDAVFYDAHCVSCGPDGKVKILGPAVHYCHGYKLKDRASVPKSDTLEINPEKGIKKEELINWLDSVSTKEN